MRNYPINQVKPPWLPQEIQDIIWQLSIPTPRPIQITIRVNNLLQDRWVWGTGPFTMLKVCKQSRQMALAVYRSRLESADNVYIYMKHSLPLVGLRQTLEVFPIVSCSLLGCRLIKSGLQDMICLVYYWNWPPEEDELVVSTIIWKSRYRHYMKVIPRRLNGLLCSLCGDSSG